MQHLLCFTLFEGLSIVNIFYLYAYTLSQSFWSELKRNTQNLDSLASLTKNDPAYSTRHSEYWKVDASRTNYGTQMQKYLLPKTLNDHIDNQIDLINTTL